MNERAIQFQEWFRIREALDRFHTEIGILVQRANSLPADGSPARRDEVQFARPISVHTVCSQAIFWVEVAGEHLTAFLKAASEPCETIAPWVSVRALLEACALGTWLLQPEIEVRDRVARSIGIRYAGQNELRKLLDVGEGMDSRVAVERLDHLETTALQLGYAQLRSAKDRRTGAGAPVPSTTELVREQLNEEFLYRWASAVAHSHLWAIQQVGFRLEESPPGATQDPDFRGMTKTVRPEYFVYLALAAAQSMGRLLWNLCLYFGWSQREWASALEQLFDVLRIPDRDRFWIGDKTR